MRTESGGYRRDHLCALAQRVEVDAKEVRIMGSKSVLLRTLVAASGAKTAGFGVPKFCAEMARPRGFEPLTPRSVVWCSIQLSYGRMLPPKDRPLFAGRRMRAADVIQRRWG